MRYIVLLLCFLLFTPFTLAQDAQWRAWLYDAALGEMALIENTGALLKQFILPVPEFFAEYSYSPYLAVSPDGSRLAYAVRGTTTRGTEDPRSLVFIVYDTEGERILFNYEPPELPIATSLDFNAVAWNNTGNVVAFAYATGEDEETDGWRIVANNAINGTQLGDLLHVSQFFEAQTQAFAPYLLPVIQYYSEASVSFNLVPYQNYDFNLELDNYEWDIVTGRVSQTNRAPRLRGDTWQATGESISPMRDERVNYDAMIAPYTNALQVYRPEIGARVPFFATATYDISQAYFVQNGAAILVFAQDLLSFEQRYLLVNRAGVAQSLPQLSALEQRFQSTPKGFIYMIDSETPFLLELNTLEEGFPQSAIWQAPIGSHFVPVWVSPQAEENYAAWAQLAPPLFVSQTIIVPVSQAVAPDSLATRTPTSGGIITVNSVAMINTTGNDRLNMRDTPSLTGTVIARVDSGTRVVVIGGPVSEDGFVWWEVRLPTGQTGWLVERADGLQTLLPLG